MKMKNTTQKYMVAQYGFSIFIPSDDNSPDSASSLPSTFSYFPEMSSINNL
jgi:hypothetical protein